MGFLLSSGNEEVRGSHKRKLRLSPTQNGRAELHDDKEGAELLDDKESAAGSRKIIYVLKTGERTT